MLEFKKDVVRTVLIASIYMHLPLKAGLLS